MGKGRKVSWKCVHPSIFIVDGEKMCPNSTFFLLSVPPRVKPRPEDGNIVVKKGTEVTLECSASGNPLPVITSNREVKLLFSFSDTNC